MPNPLVAALTLLLPLLPPPDTQRKYYLNALEVEAEIHKTRDVNRQYNCRVEHVDGKLRW